MKRILILLIPLVFARYSSAQDDQSKPWYQAAGGKAEWIWLQGDKTPEQAFFRKTFEIPEGASALKIYSSCDNQSTLTLDGKLPVGSSSDWMYPVITEIALEPGTHTLAVEGKNRGGIAAFVCVLEYEKDGAKHRIYTDKSWKISANGPEGWTKPEFDDSTWNSDQIRIMGKFGSGPWKIPGAKKKATEYTEAPDPLDPANITTLSGFSVEHLYTVPKTEQGSWVSLTEDDKGRLYASDQKDAGLFQIEIVDTQEGPSVTVKQLNISEPGSKKDISGAQGLQFAKGNLYFHKNGGHMFEITDEDGDGELDTALQVPSERGGGEHGNHDVIIAPDGEDLIMIGGNHAPLAEHTKSSVRGWDEDLLLPRMWDARGHARGKLAPGGWVTRLDPETHTQEVLSVGYRNQYGIALNKYGDLFTYDADMEWDLGMPWYRPTRVCFVASGSDYGWRSGTGKWPTYFEDSLPPVVEIGPGCPTGVIPGTGSNFPEKYQQAIFALDWTFGTIYAVHLTEKGAGYTGEAEPFLYGSPLPLTDAVIGKDGNMYFLIGGRGTQSALFRVSYDGSGQIPATAPDPEAEHARKLRRSLEAFHGSVDPTAVETAWPLLSSDYRFLRHAARVAIESQPVDEWATRFYSETNPQAVITAGVALARQGEPSLRNRVVEKLLTLDVTTLPETQKLGLLRAYALTFIRMGQPDAIQKAKVIASIDPLLPSESDDLNNELIKMLVYLEASSVIEKGMQLITDRKPPVIPDWSELAARNSRYGGTVQAVLDNHPPSREIGYALMLSNLRDGWTMENRRRFFTFLNEAAKASGGASYPGFLANIRQQALAGCSDEERSALSDITGENFNPVPDFEITPPKGPGKVWTFNEAVSQGSRRGANFENGRSLYFSVGCGACHRFRGLGGGVGPDLTSIPTKFDDKYVIEAIIDPGKDISDQYGSFIVTMKDGSTHNGITVEKGDQLEIYLPDPVAKPTVVSKDDVKSIEQSPISQMPPGLINALNKDELRDLMAYLMSGGNPDDRRFQK